MQPLGQVAIATELDRPAGQDGVAAVTLDPLAVYEADLQDKGNHQNRKGCCGFMRSPTLILIKGDMKKHRLMVELTQHRQTHGSMCRTNLY